ncbi:diguanylate cyclase [Thiomicrospira microaerophila]|uniref:sensor domain-containing diguanylate cyclase n=1 Tax=Thiomicrospira microaerophila TaxID=406020 RepID=UPI00200E9B56|nr:diguanylate cyclase [Thiomicrospira microaerophila]UQB41788.1 diguanylate cyclase [Thiomicrospira microaerophila]
MQHVIGRYKVWIAIVLLGVLLFALWGAMFHKQQATSLRDSVFQHYTQETANQVNLLIQQQKNASVALALMLAENPNIKNLMLSECCDYQHDLKQVADRIERESSINSIWLHAVNRDGISLARSWTDKRGDSLIEVRSDLRGLLAGPHQTPSTSISTGLFTMSFKTTVPVFESGVLLGVVEVISQFQPLVNQMTEKGYPSLVLADRRYRDQLTLARSGVFIDDYYLVNTQPAERWIGLLKDIELSQFLTEQTYLLKDNYMINPVPIFNVEKEVEGYWVLFVPTDMINFHQIDDLQSRFMLVSAVVLVMLVLLGLLLLSRQQVALQGQYYKEIIDSASDILYVSDLDHIIYANGHFFEFFDEFDSLTAFHKRYQCVCDLFEPGEGLLQREINGVYWIQYILNHPEVVHKAKIVQHGQAHYFAIKVQPLNQTVFGRYTIAMQDISELELAQTKLVQLSQTDELTGIGNRLFFNKNLAHELARAKRHDLSLCIMMFDIDHFKSINDQYGHDVGDKVLKELTLLVMGQLRESDLFCRFGGEEFIVLLPDTDMENAKILTERLLSLIAQYYFDALPSHRITCSFGLTQIQQGDNYNTVLKRVDKALYASKNGGRNQIQIR